MESCVIIVNWNGWKDTIECLESVFRLESPIFRVIVCDNGSTDESMEKIRAWARGELIAEAANPELAHLMSPPYLKPIPWCEMTREEAESGRGDYDAHFVLIQTGADLGYAGGNNVGLRYALGDPECKYFWILNNDTVVEPCALSSMVQVVRRNAKIGMCGSLNVSYYRRGEVQAQGGMRYGKWTGRVRVPSPCLVENVDSHLQRMDYIHGASMLVTRTFVEQIGFMDETYFIYFEELDWTMRARDKFELGYARESVIYHKEGASIGTHTDRMKRSLTAERFASRNRVVFTKRYFPWAVPSVIMSVGLSALYRMLRGDMKRARVILRGAFMGLVGSLHNG